MDTGAIQNADTAQAKIEIEPKSSGFGKGAFFSGKRKGKAAGDFAKCNGSCNNGSCK